MELRPGYKPTEAGVIPEDWEAKRLGSIAPIATGNTPPTREPANYGDEYLFVSPVDMGLTKHISRTEKMLSRKGFSISRPFPPGSVLFVCIGSTIGKCGIAGETLTSNQQINAILPSAGLSSNYLYYAVCAVSSKVKSLAGEQAVPIVNKTAFSNTAIPVPATKAEQEAIAEPLSDADALIESLEQLVAKKRQLKQGAMQELLTGKKRLPGYESKPGYKQTEVGVIPEDWVVASVGQHLRRMPSYGINAAAVSFDSRFPTYVRITDITEDGQFSKITKSSVEHPAAASYLLEPGDIVFARTGASVGKSYRYNPNDGRLVFAGFLIRLSPDPERLNPAFLSFYAQSRPYWHWVKVNSMRSGQPGINGREYASLPIPLPTRDEQEAIAAILSDMDAEIAALETRLTKARQLKQGMMQELLTGRIRLV